MKEKENKKTVTGQNDSEQKQELRADELRRKLASGPDELISQKGTDEALDKTLLKEFLADYKEQNPVQLYVKKDLKPYLKIFPLEFYKQIYRLKGWPTDGKKLYMRPGIVGAWTNEIIYYRFPPEVLAELRKKNPCAAGSTRLYKHFQYLTEIGEVQLKQFIADSISMMSKSTYWNEFKRSMAKEYGLPYQGDLFDQNK